MKKRMAKSGFKHIKDIELLNLSGTVLLAMQDNSNFPDIQPPLAEIQAAYDDYQENLKIASKQGSPLDKSVKNDSKERLAALMKRLSFYVNTVAGGSLSVILSSGIPLMGEPEKQSIPPTPERLRLTDYLQKGQLSLNFDPVPEAWLYEYSYMRQRDMENEQPWPEALSTTRSRGNILAPLEEGVRYFARVRTRNGAGY